MSGPLPPTTAARRRVRESVRNSPSWYARETFLRSVLLHFGQRKSILSPLAAPLQCDQRSFLTTHLHRLSQLLLTFRTIKPSPAQLVARRPTTSSMGHFLSHKQEQLTIVV